MESSTSGDLRTVVGMAAPAARKTLPEVPVASVYRVPVGLQHPLRRGLGQDPHGGDALTAFCLEPLW